MRSPAKRYDVVGTGSMVLDRIFRTTRILGPEEKAELRAEPGRSPLEERVGGVTLNHLGWARVLGLQTAIFGKQADDREGRLLRDGMDQLGIDHSIDLGGSASSFAQVFVDDAGERAIYMSRGATSELTPGDLDAHFADWIRAGAMFSSEVSQLPLATVLRAFQIARDAGVRTVLDLDVPVERALPQLGTLEELEAILALTDVLKLSLAAARGFVAPVDPEALLRAVCARTPARVVALTLGKEGAWVAWRDAARELQCGHVDAVGVDARDTTGAGDAFLGGLMAGLLQGLPATDAVRLANACGAACCEQVGAFPDALAGCRRRIEDHLERLPGPALQLRPLAFPEPAPLDPATQRFLSVAADELVRVASQLDADSIRRATGCILDSERRGGRVHVTGIGKPAHVAGYVAALLSSTGTAACVLDATEATHGSAGQLRGGDVVIAISNSGSTRELMGAIDAIRGMGARVIAVTANEESPLAQQADVTLRAAVADEGGPLGLAPRASILAEILVLQALSVELQAVRGFSKRDYHQRHPSGALGRKSLE